MSSLVLLQFNIMLFLLQEITSRREYIPLPLRVPKGLQKALPYHLKPKITPNSQKEQRVLVVKDPHEVQVSYILFSLINIYSIGFLLIVNSLCN